MANRFITGEEMAERILSEIKKQAAVHNVDELELLKTWVQYYQTTVGGFPSEKVKNGRPH